MNSIARMRSLRHCRLLKFLVVGMVNTLFGYGVYAGLVYLRLPYLIALFMATVAGIVFNYFSFGRMVFQTRGEWKIFAKFVIAYGMVYAVNAALLWLLTHGHHISAYIAQAACVVPSVAMSWILMNWWVYKGTPSRE